MCVHASMCAHVLYRWIHSVGAKFHGAYISRTKNLAVIHDFSFAN